MPRSAVADINAANLAGYRAVVFVNSSGDVLDAPGETALQDYVNNGGGFVGIGETALLEQGGAAFFNTLIGLAADPRDRHARVDHQRRRVPRPRASGDARTCR